VVDGIFVGAPEEIISTGDVYFMEGALAKDFALDEGDFAELGDAAGAEGPGAVGLKRDKIDQEFPGFLLENFWRTQMPKFSLFNCNLQSKSLKIGGQSACQDYEQK
jgi:hypothetical protein